MGNYSCKGTGRKSPPILGKAIEKASPNHAFLHCSFEKWVAGAGKSLGFADTADFETIRDDFRSKGLLMKPDTTEGRCLKVYAKTKTHLTIEERRLHKNSNVSIPPYHSSGKIPQILEYRIQRSISVHTWEDGVSVIGCNRNICVVQFLQRKQCYVPEFYVIDLSKQNCIGKFYTKDCSLVWHECYISPDLTRIVLRPDVSTYEWSAQTHIRRDTIGGISVMYMKQFPDSGGHAITFDNRHGNQYMFRAKDKDLQLYDLDKMEVVQTCRHTDLVFSIRQLYCSQSGDYISARCTPPILSHAIKIKIVIFSSQTLNVLQQIEPVGGYWMISLISLQVFPRFSACDSAIAVMRHGPTKPRVHVFKLPVVMTTLQHSCRKNIRRFVWYENLEELPLPMRLRDYLRYEI